MRFRSSDERAKCLFERQVNSIDTVDWYMKQIAGNGDTYGRDLLEIESSTQSESLSAKAEI